MMIATYISAGVLWLLGCAMCVGIGETWDSPERDEEKFGGLVFLFVAWLFVHSIAIGLLILIGAKT